MFMPAAALGATDLRPSGTQVSDEASLQAALQSAWPRQALAQSIAGWQEATGAQVLLQSTAFGDLTSRLDAEGAVRVNSAL